MAKWQKVGEIGVDAGLCMVGDPCYVSYNNHKTHPIHNWKTFCNQLNDDVTQLKNGLARVALGIVVESGRGDGIYPVYIKRNGRKGRVAELKVVFD